MCSTCFPKQCRLEALYNIYFWGGGRGEGERGEGERGKGGKGKEERGERGRRERGEG